VRTFFGQVGSSDAGSAIFENKKFFRNLWCVHTDKEGRSQCKRFAARGLIFVILCGTFMEGPYINCKENKLEYANPLLRLRK